MRNFDNTQIWTLGIVLAALLTGSACSDSDSSGRAAVDWYHPTKSSDALSVEGTDASDPEVAVDSDGSMVVAWQQSDGTDDRIFMAEYRGGRWTKPTRFEHAISPPGSQAFSPLTATATNGEALIVWEQWNGSHFQIYISERTGNTWIHPEDLDDHISLAGANATDPVLATDQYGNAIVAWRQWSGTGWQVFMSERRGGLWEHPADLSSHISPAGQDVDDLTIAMNSNNDALIAWRQSNGSDRQIFISECRGGVWKHPVDLTSHISPAGTECDDPAVALNWAGEAVVVWEQQKNGFWQIYMSDYFYGGWAHPDANGNISPDGTNAWGISLALNKDGNAVIAWEQWNSSNYRIYISERRGSAWYHPTFQSAISPSGSDASVAATVMSDAGHAVVAWMQSNGDYQQVYRSDYRGGDWTHPEDLTEHISPDGTNALFTGQIGMDRNGDCFIVWEQYDGVNWQLFNAHCIDNVWYLPMSFLSFFSLEGYDAENPVLVMDPGGTAAIVWEQSDGSNQRIYNSAYR